MPKVIKNVEQKIFDASLELFGEKGYAQVEMKMISDKVGVGVGTLYNYYGNKKQLYTTLLQRSWEQTYSNLDIALNSSRSVEDKFEIFIKILL